LSAWIISSTATVVDTAVFVVPLSFISPVYLPGVKPVVLTATIVCDDGETVTEVTAGLIQVAFAEIETGKPGPT
jgi:hypothetical protein